MKIRNGFVSNSSSSSFAIFGCEVDMNKLAEQLGLDEDAGDDIYDEIGQRIDAAGLEIYHTEGWGPCLGRSWNQIGDDETGKQFCNRVEEDVKKIVRCPVSFCSLSGEYPT